MFNLAERYPKLWSFLEQVSTVVLGSLLFWLSLLPIVTAPAAFAALFAAVGPIVRGDSTDWLSLFTRTFKKAFLPGLLLGLVNVLVGVILWVDIRFFWLWGNPLARVVAYLMGSVALFVLLTNLYAWPLLGWYPQGFRAIVKKSALLAVAHPISALGGWLLGGIAVGLITFLPPYMLLLVPLVGPGLWILLWGAGAWRTFRRYESLGPLPE